MCDAERDMNTRQTSLERNGWNTMTREEILQIAKPILFNTDMVRAILDDRKSVTRRVIKLKYDNTHHEIFTNKYGTRLIEIENDVPGVTFGKRDDGTTWRRLRGFIEPKSPYKRSDYLYVRETWHTNPLSIYEYGNEPNKYVYKADYDGHCGEFGWRPSIHMPKEAARIFLRVTDVRVERLQDITEEQAIHEGIFRLYDNLSDDEYSAWAGRTHINAQKSEWGWKNYLWHGNFGKHGTGNAISDAWEYQYSSYDDPVDSFSSLWNSTLPLNQWDKYGWKANPWVWKIEFERVEITSECGS